MQGCFGIVELVDEIPCVATCFAVLFVHVVLKAVWSLSLLVYCARVLRSHLTLADKCEVV